jgi:hypothetical protein
VDFGDVLAHESGISTSLVEERYLTTLVHPEKGTRVLSYRYSVSDNE